MSIQVLQSSWWGRESWLLCLICLPGVLWGLSGSSSRCHGVVCSLWLWYFLIILTYYFLYYGNNSKSIKGRVTILALCTSSHADWYLYKVSWIEHVIALCFVVRYFMSIQVLQSSWWGRESWLLCLICLPGVLWGLSGSSSRCHGVVCSLWLCYFLIILTYYFLYYGNNSKSIKGRVTILALCTSSHADWYLYKVSWIEHKRFSSIERTRFVTDRRTPEEKQTLKGGDIIRGYF